MLHLYNDLGYMVHVSSFDGEVLLPRNYESLAQSQFRPGTLNNIFMERLQPCGTV